MLIKKPTISVALCTFNGQHFVDEQLMSILNQSIPPDEIIVSDDCSNDNTVEIVSLIANKYPSILKVNQNDKNIGYIKNFEKAIRHTSGDIVFLSDQDDIWFKNKIASHLSFFKNNNKVGLVYSDARYFDTDSGPAEDTVYQRRKNDLMYKYGKEAYVNGRGVRVKGCTLAVRSVLKQVVLPIGEGWGHDDWLAYIAHAVSDVIFINEPLMYYRIHGMNYSNDSLTPEHAKKNLNMIRGYAVNNYFKQKHSWQVMLQHLKWIKGSGFTYLNKGINIDRFINECYNLIKVFELRGNVRKFYRAQRIYPCLKYLLAGYYTKYCDGLRSFFKDIIDDRQK